MSSVFHISHFLCLCSSRSAFWSSFVPVRPVTNPAFRNHRLNDGLSEGSCGELAVELALDVSGSLVEVKDIDRKLSCLAIKKVEEKKTKLRVDHTFGRLTTLLIPQLLTPESKFKRPILRLDQSLQVISPHDGIISASDYVAHHSLPCFSSLGIAGQKS